MNRYLGYVCFFAVLFCSCKEVPPPIRFSDRTAIDTTYVLTTVPAAEPHNVLVEDFTGPSCSNCPNAKSNYLDPWVRDFPGRVNVIAIHVRDYSQANPVKGAKYDFRDSIGTIIQNSVFSPIFAMPIAGVDRMPYGNASQGSKFQILKESWGSSITAQLAQKDSINLALSSTYNPVSGIADIEVKVTYLYPTTTLHNMTIAITEDSLIDLQDYPTEVDSFYEFEHVFRGVITDVPYGDSVLTRKILPTFPAKEAGRVYVRRYSYKPRLDLVVKHLHAVAFVHADASKNGTRVVQSKQVKLAP
jgi:hypothetical protein